MLNEVIMVQSLFMIVITFSAIIFIGYLIKTSVKSCTFPTLFLTGLLIPPFAWIYLFASLGKPCIAFCESGDWPMYEFIVSNIVIALVIPFFASNNKKPIQDDEMSRHPSFALGFFFGTVVAMVMIIKIVEIYYV